MAETETWYDAHREWYDAHENAAEIFVRAEGVAYGLVELLQSHYALHPQSPSIGAMTKIAEALLDTIKSGADAHNDEFKAIARRIDG